MKFITFGDIHITENMAFHSSVNNRLCELAAAFNKIVQYASRNKIKYIFCTGDTFDSFKVTPAELNVFTEFIQNALKISNIYFVTGNHEIDGYGNCVIQALSGMKFDTEYEFVCNNPYSYFQRFIPGLDILFTGIGFIHTIEGFVKKLNRIIVKSQKTPAKQHILFGHQAVQGRWFKSSKSSSGIPEDLFREDGIIGNNFEYVVLGDFHKHQDLPFQKGIYTGCLTQNDFKDEGNPTLFHVFDTEDIYNYESIDVAAPLFHILNIDLDAPSCDLSGLSSGGYVRICISGTEAQISKFNAQELLKQIETKYPKKVTIQTSRTDRNIKISNAPVKRNMNDADIVSEIIKQNTLSESIEEQVLYEKGVYYLSEGRRKLEI